MLFKRRDLQGIESGKVDLAFRRWAQARVKVGTRLRTAVGVLEVLSVDVVPGNGISARDARRAGFASLDELLASLRSVGPGRVHRIRLKHAGADPRIALRARASLSAAEGEELAARLARMDVAAESPWTVRVLRLIGRKPGVRAADLALSLGQETRRFKVRVRKLKELGLTESLEVGYRLSPRGQALLKRLASPRRS